MKTITLEARFLLAALGCSISLYACKSDEKTDAVADAAQADARTDAHAGDIECPEPTLENGTDTVIMLDQDGLERSYHIHVPAKIDPRKPAPLVLNYHGLNSTAQQQIAFSDLDTTADEHGFIVVYPVGISNSFSGGSCCNNLATPRHQTDDAAFARVLVADVSSRICVDSRRVYSTGMSNGGYMSEYNACKNADIFAAVAPVSAMGFRQTGCEPSRPIPMIVFNGTQDSLVNYTNVGTHVMTWLERNGCEGEPAREDFETSYCDTWSNCNAGVEVRFCTLTDMDHCWPGNPLCPFGTANTEISANDEMWRFMSRFTLPDGADHEG